MARNLYKDLVIWQKSIELIKDDGPAKSGKSLEFWIGRVKSRHSRVGGNPENYNFLKTLDSCFRRNDMIGEVSTFCEFIKDVYKIAEALPKPEEFNLKQQLKRSVVSVALNIAKGKTDKHRKILHIY